MPPLSAKLKKAASTQNRSA